MTNSETQRPQTQAQRFDYFGYIKFLVLKQYYMNLFQGTKTDKLTIEVKSINYKANQWLAKQGAMKFDKWYADFKEDGTMVTKMIIKDINLDAKAQTKDGKEFAVFNQRDIAKAVKSAQKALIAQ